MSTIHYGEISPSLGIITPIVKCDDMGTNNTSTQLDIDGTLIQLNLDTPSEVGVVGSDTTSKVSLSFSGDDATLQFVEQIDTATETGSKSEVIVTNSSGSDPVKQITIERTLGVSIASRPRFMMRNAGTAALTMRNIAEFARVGNSSIYWPNFGFTETFFMVNVTTLIYLPRDATASSPPQMGFCNGTLTNYSVCIRNPGGQVGEFTLSVRQLTSSTVDVIEDITLSFDTPDFTFTDPGGILYKLYYGTFTNKTIAGNIGIRSDNTTKALTGTITIFGFTSVL